MQARADDTGLTVTTDVTVLAGRVTVLAGRVIVLAGRVAVTVLAERVAVYVEANGQPELDVDVEEAAVARKQPQALLSLETTLVVPQLARKAGVEMDAVSATGVDSNDAHKLVALEAYLVFSRARKQLSPAQFRGSRTATVPGALAKQTSRTRALFTAKLGAMMQTLKECPVRS